MAAAGDGGNDLGFEEHEAERRRLMQEIVDDEEEDGHDDERVPRRKKVSWLDPVNWDYDEIFPFQQPKMVRIKDRWLGITYWVIVTGVIMYMIIVAFHMDGKHTRQGTGIGTVITKFQGKGFSGDTVFDGPDLRFPIIEPSGAFIMTRRISVQGQKIGSCVDWDNPTKCPCKQGGTCNADGYCEVQGWCPSLGQGNVESPPAGALYDNITGLEDSTLRISSAIAFPSIGNKLYVTGDSPGAHDVLRRIKLGELLQMAHPPVDLQDLEFGALIGVSFFWNCDVGWKGQSPCEPHIVIKRLDGGQGFVQMRARHKRLNGEETRDAFYMYGLRILVDSSGIGRQFSLELMVIQIGSALALLKTASMAADFMMLRLYPADRVSAYSKCKFVLTKDYSDLQDRLNLIDEDQRQAEMIQRKNSSRGGGPRILLSEGVGGAGSNPTNFLRPGVQFRDITGHRTTQVVNQFRDRG